MTLFVRRDGSYFDKDIPGFEDRPYISMGVENRHRLSILKSLDDFCPPIETEYFYRKNFTVNSGGEKHSWVYYIEEGNHRAEISASRRICDAISLVLGSEMPIKSNDID